MADFGRMPPVGQVVVYERGAFDPKGLAAGEAVLVGGKPGSYVQTPSESFGPGPTAPPDGVPAVPWEYAPGGLAAPFPGNSKIAEGGSGALAAGIRIEATPTAPGA